MNALALAQIELDWAQQRLTRLLMAERSDRAAIAEAVEMVCQAERRALEAERRQARRYASLPGPAK